MTTSETTTASVEEKATPAKTKETAAIVTAKKRSSRSAESQMVPYNKTIGNRPIVIGSVEVVNTDTLPNHRPIVKSAYIVKYIENNHRPILVSKIPVPTDSPLPNNRPIVDKALEDPRDLMGFID
jgi:hypothetical protein